MLEAIIILAYLIFILVEKYQKWHSVDLLSSVYNLKNPRRVDLDLIQQVEKQLGLDFQTEKMGPKAPYTATRTDEEWTLTFKSRSLTISPNNAVFPEMGICLTTSEAPIQNSWPLKETGNALFDAKFEVRTSSEKLLSLLDPPLIKELHRLDFMLDGNTMTFYELNSLRQVELALEASRKLIGADPLWSALTHLKEGATDHLDYYLKVLVRYYPGREETREVASRFADHPLWRVQLPALRLLNEEGISRLRKHARNKEHQADSIEALGAVDDNEAMLVLMEILETEELTARSLSIMLETLASRTHAHFAHDTFVDALISAVQKNASAWFLELAARILAKAKSPRACPYLLSLAEENDEAFWSGAAKALELCGDVTTVAPLRRLMEKSSKEKYQALLGALTTIQMRLGEVEAGWLTLSQQATEQGALSLVGEEQGGRLSLADNQQAE